MSPVAISVGEIVQMLEGRALSLCWTLFPNGHATATRFRVGSIHGEPGASLSVHLRPARNGKIGLWCDWAAGLRGDLLDLISCARCGGDKGKAVAWARDFLGLSDGKIDIEAIRRQADEARKQAAAKAAVDGERKKGFAFRIWGIEAEKQWRGTPVEAYLRGRAIDVDRCGSLGALRYHPECMVSETGELLPAMVAAVCGPNGKFSACHRTYLEDAGNGLYRKSTIVRDHKGRPDPKRSLGEIMGGHISLHKGVSGVSMRHAPDGDVAVISEGIENGLTLVPAVPEYRHVCAVNLGNMSRIVMPETITKRILVRDAALMKPQAEAGFRAAVEFHRAQCTELRVVDFGSDDANAFAQQLREGTAA